MAGLPRQSLRRLANRRKLIVFQGGRQEPAEMALNPRRHPLNLIRVMPAKGRT
jgi:hypothetical protein